MEVDDQWRILGFKEKPERPKSIPAEPDWALVSMGNYIFETKLLLETLEDDAAKTQSTHDFGRDILPRLVKEGRRIHAYDFRKNRIPTPLKGEEPSYWRDIGTIEAYYEANMELRAVDPSLNLYNQSWPIRTVSYGDPPAKFAFDEDGRRGMALNHHYRQPHSELSYRPQRPHSQLLDYRRCHHHEPGGDWKRLPAQAGHNR